MSETEFLVVAILGVGGKSLAILMLLLAAVFKMTRRLKLGSNR